MPKKLVRYTKNAIAHEIEMNWKIFFRSFKIFYDGVEVGEFSSQKELNKGGDFKLPNGEILTVKKSQKIFTTIIEVMIDGEPVEGSDGDPNILIKNAYIVTGVLFGLNLVVGILGYIIKIPALANLGFGWYNLLLSCFYFVPIVLGYKNKSWIALCFILAVFLVDTLSTIFWMVELLKQGHNINGGSIILRFVFGTPIFLGAKAAFMLRDKDEKNESSVLDL